MEESVKRALLDELKKSLVEKKEIIEEIQQDYILVKKGRLCHAVGGAFVALIATGLVTYKAALGAVGEKGASDKLQQITKLHDEAVSLLANVRVNATTVDEFTTLIPEKYEKELSFFRDLESEVSKSLKNGDVITIFANNNSNFILMGNKESINSGFVPPHDIYKVAARRSFDLPQNPFLQPKNINKTWVLKR